VIVSLAKRPALWAATRHGTIINKQATCLWEVSMSLTIRQIGERFACE
jgi:hypothetical protein